MNHRDYVAERGTLREEYAIRRELIRARLHAGLTQAQLAERMGTSQSAIARMERGGAIPRLDTLHRLAMALGLTFEIRPDAPLVSKELVPAG